jgi:heme oxygenase
VRIGATGCVVRELQYAAATMMDLRMLARLTDETQHHHAGADSEIDRYLFRTTVTRRNYRTYLARAYGFLLPLETSLATTAGLDDVIDVRVRAKSTLVVRDLLALGLTMTEVIELPQCQTIPAFAGPAQALGWMYVAEWSLLASSVLRGHLATFLPAEMGIASAYLSCYAGQVGTRWRELGEAMERVAETPNAGNRLVVAANDAFRTLIRFRSNELQQISVTCIAG